uniref:Uncharacterized protein n=1 Tax=Glossina pallidipes TaxID=7398 RepID=A0A1B0AH05_GLOPL
MISQPTPEYIQRPNKYVPNSARAVSFNSRSEVFIAPKVLRALSSSSLTRNRRFSKFLLVCVTIFKSRLTVSSSFCCAVCSVERSFRRRLASSSCDSVLHNCSATATVKSSLKRLGKHQQVKMQSTTDEASLAKWAQTFRARLTDYIFKLKITFELGTPIFATSILPTTTGQIFITLTLLPINGRTPSLDSSEYANMRICKYQFSDSISERFLLLTLSASLTSFRFVVIVIIERLFDASKPALPVADNSLSQKLLAHKYELN